MKTNGIGKRILISALIAAIMLTMHGPRVFAESLQPESQSETSEEQLENQPEVTEEESVNQNDQSEEEPESQPETTEEESVDQNDQPEEEPENQPEITEEESANQNDQPEEEQESQPEITDEESVNENVLAVFQSENQPAAAAEQTYPKLTDDILNKCKVPGMNPPGVTVNLFDYWQDERGEIAHDQMYGPVLCLTYKMGISKGHLLRFGYTCPPDGCGICKEYGKYGAWNDSQTGKPYPGIVKNKLGAYGFPELNLDTKSNEEFGGYNNLAENEKNEYLSDEKKVENLSYLFSPSDSTAREYRAMYIDVQGLFQSDKDGYYYYNSTKNFASYDRDTNSFILYNSPGVAEESTNEDSRGQFFPFNKAEDVFDTYTTVGDEYHLCYVDREGKSIGVPNSYYKPISIDNNSYLHCSADSLNHYLGMTLEFSFQQPENGRWSNGKPMTFEFSGDDDVWIFIDNVLVADLGGLHDACSLKIDFSTGEVEVEGEQPPHTLLKSFKDAYGEELGGIAFNNNTFADNTVHTFKMFYMERGHAASDLALKFNVQTMPDEPVEEEFPNVPNEDTDENRESPNVPNEDTDENEEPVSDSAQENTSEAEESIISVSDDLMVLDTTGIPQTGDDSRIGWLSALCIISLSGIGAAVYNLIFVRRKQKNHSTEQ